MNEPPSRKITVLIVEDEILIRWAIAEYLQDRGLTVIAVSHAADAIAALKNYPFEIDVVFSDVRMPGDMDGFGLAKWIEANRPNVALILTSGHAQADDAAHQLCEKYGEIIRKPYDFETIATRLRGVLKPNI